MEIRQRACCSVLVKQMCLLVVVMILGVEFIEAKVNKVRTCPVRNPTLYAYEEGDSYKFYYDFDPLIQTNIDFLDRLLSSDKNVMCDWVVRSKEDHSVVVQIEDFLLVADSGSKHGDCLYIYDGKNAEGKLLDQLCGGDMSPRDTKRYNATGRFLFLVYHQGERTGPRSFTIFYKSVPESKDMILKIAGIACGSVAALAILFLLFKFTNCCGPCRHRWCPDEDDDGDEENGTTQRELRPLTPPVAAPADRNRNPDLSRSPGVAVVQGGRNQPVAQVEEDDGEESLPPDEPPPSYDSIFGLDEDRSKAN